MIKSGLIASLVALSAAAFACSSSSNSGGASNACVYAGTSSSCQSCVQNSCGSQVSSGESACSGYLNCACPGGSFSQTAAESSSCQQQIDSSCASAEQSIVSCEEQNCASQCGISGGSSGGGSGSGSGSGSSSGGTGDTTFSCVVTTGTTTACTGYTGPSSETSTYQQSCTAEGGTAGTGCPTTNLVGCCKTSVSGVTSEACYYDAQTGMAAQSACTGSDETWSTSP
jgi:hypothetical protein